MIKSKIGPIEEEIEEAKDSAKVLYNVLERLKKIIEEGLSLIHISEPTRPY